MAVSRRAEKLLQHRQAVLFCLIDACVPSVSSVTVAENTFVPNASYLMKSPNGEDTTLSSKYSFVLHYQMFVANCCQQEIYRYNLSMQ